MAEKKVKRSPKQEARSLRASAAKLRKQLVPLYAKQNELADKIKAVRTAAEKAVVKAARLLCPFRERQVLKHVWRSQYTRVAWVIHSPDPPYYFCYGYRVRPDGKTRLPGDAKLLDIEAWEPIPAKK